MDKKNATATEKPAKKKKLSLTLKRPPRFGESISENLTELSNPIIPHNMAKNTAWAVMNFREWRSERAVRYPVEVCPEDLLHHSSFDVIGLNRWLSLFIHETRRSDGKQHPFTAKPLHN